MYDWVGAILGLCTVSCVLALVSSAAAVFLQLKNYRRLREQRLVVRILCVVPVFATASLAGALDWSVAKVLDPLRDIYEAVVVYTFFKLLVLLLGGEREIIQRTVDKPAVGVLWYKVHIGNPRHFLAIKRMVLQYVWVKPLLSLCGGISWVTGFEDDQHVQLALVVAQNVTVTLSLYSLALFWRCLYAELKPFDPWRKFLCVKIIIFASYWQGVMVDVLSWQGAFDHWNVPRSNRVQNSLLCLEMIFFAWMHWTSFPYSVYTAASLPDSARVDFWHAVRDCFLVGDILYDLKMTTLHGDNYSLRNFDLPSDTALYPHSETFNRKIYQGLRVSADGNKRYWIEDVETKSNTNTSNRKNSVASGGGSLNSYKLIANQHKSLVSQPVTAYNSVLNEVDELSPQFYDGSSSVPQHEQQIAAEEETIPKEGTLDVEDERLYRFVRQEPHERRLASLRNHPDYS